MIDTRQWPEKFFIKNGQKLICPKVRPLEGESTKEGFG